MLERTVRQLCRRGGRGDSAGGMTYVLQGTAQRPHSSQRSKVAATARSAVDSACLLGCVSVVVAVPRTRKIEKQVTHLHNMKERLVAHHPVTPSPLLSHSSVANMHSPHLSCIVGK